MHQGVFKIILVIILIISMAIASACAFLRSTEVLEYENIVQYKLIEKNNVPLYVSGLCGKSALCTKNIELKRRDDVLIVLVHIGFCGTGMSGNFNVHLPITPEINEVRFGNNEHILWTRAKNASVSQP